MPGVWFRLLSQAALGLHTAHQAGLIHGNLHAGQVVFTADGVLKLCGFGEPSWLALEPPPADADATVAADLAALGRCAAAWAAPSVEKKAPKPKPLPDALQGVLRRLTGGAEPYPDASQHAVATKRNFARRRVATKIVYSGRKCLAYSDTKTVTKRNNDTRTNSNRDSNCNTNANSIDIASFSTDKD